MKIYFIMLLGILFIGCNPKKVKKQQNEVVLKEELLLVEKIKYTLNENNLIQTEKIETESIFNGEKETSFKEKVYQYFKNGQLKTIQTFYLNQESSMLTEKIHYFPNYTERFGFWNNDTIRYEKETFKDGLLIEKVIEMNSISGDKIQEITTNKYNKDGEIVKKAIFDFKMQLKNVHDYTYNIKKDFIEVENRNSQGELVQVEDRFFTNGELNTIVLKTTNISLDSIIYSNGTIVQKISYDLLSGNKNIIKFQYDKEDRLIERKTYLNIN